MKILATAAVLLTLASPVFAGDADKGETVFKKCKSCHMIQSDAGEDIVKGGKTGPNLYGIIGRAAGAQEGFRYSSALEVAGAAGLIWTEEAINEFVQDPSAYLEANGGSGRSKMSFKLKKGGEDVAAYLASITE